MSGLLSKTNLKIVTTGQLQKPIPLDQLLITELQFPQQVQKSQLLPQQPSLELTGSRSARQAGLISEGYKSAPQISFNASNIPAPTLGIEQIRIQDIYREKNLIAILDRNFQSRQTNQTGDVSETLLPLSTKDTREISDTLIIKQSRPIIMGIIDFKPIVDSNSGYNFYANVLKIKKSSRRVKIDRLVKPSISDNEKEISESKIFKPIRNYLNARQAFIESLDVSNLSMAQNALGAFNLSPSTVSTISDVSNTEVIYTFVKEYAHSLLYGTSRLDESSERILASGSSLVENKDEKIELYKDSLVSKDLNAYLKLINSDDPDVEIATKCLLTLLAKEALFSYNINRNKLKIESKDPRIWYQVVDRAKVLVSPSPENSISTANNIVFKNSRNNYPYERSEIIEESGEKALTAYDFINQLLFLDEESSSAAKSPYESSYSKFKLSENIVEEFFNAETYALGEKAFLGMANRLIQDLFNFINAANSKTLESIQCSILDFAARDAVFFDRLMVYLAFRQEKYEQYAGLDLSLTGPSAILRKNSKLQSYLGQAKKINIPLVTTIGQSFDPGSLGRASGINVLTGESNSTGTQANTGLGIAGTDIIKDNSLESTFSKSFEDICEEFSRYIYDYAPNNLIITSTQGISDVTRNAIKDILVRIDSKKTIFDYLIFSFQNAVEAGIPAAEKSQGVSIFLKNSSGEEYTSFSGILKENFHSSFILLICKLMSLIIDKKITLAASRIQIQGKELKLRKNPILLSSLLDLAAYLQKASTTPDFSKIAESFPKLSSILSSLEEEEEFLRNFSKSLSSFFSKINSKFEDLRKTLNIKIDRNIKLKDKIREGFSPSFDLMKLITTYPISFNSSDLIYNGSKIKDRTISDLGYNFLFNQLTSNVNLSNRKKIIAVGIPAGLLEQISTSVTEIDDANRKSTKNNKFKISIQKIDLTNPEMKYQDLDFEFSRDLFFGGISKRSGKSLPNFLIVNDRFETSNIKYENLPLKFGEKIANNHSLDLILKLYCDLVFDIDLDESSFTVAQDDESANFIKIPAFSKIDKKSLNFLSASNLAFDPQKRNLDSFSFYNQSSNSLDISKRAVNDSFENSLFDFMNSYGSFFVANEEQKKIDQGLRFEKVLCVLLDDNDFKLEQTITNNRKSNVKDKIEKKRIDSKSSSLGMTTSQEIGIFSYRAVVSLEGVM